MTAAEDVRRVLDLDVDHGDGVHAHVHATFDRWRLGAPVYRARLTGDAASTAKGITLTAPGHALECWILLEVRP